MARATVPRLRAVAAGLLAFAAALLAACEGIPDAGQRSGAGAQAGDPPPEQAVSEAGERLAALLDSMQVEKGWLAGHHVHWKTGEPDSHPVPITGSHSHCSAFVAAASFRLGIPILEPPEHPQALLASAQCAWLADACTASSDPDLPGHVAIVRPAALSARRIAARGPQVIQAGVRNYNSTSLARGFAGHPGALARGRIRYFAHALPDPAGGAGAAPTAP